MYLSQLLIVLLCHFWIKKYTPRKYIECISHFCNNLGPVLIHFGPLICHKHVSIMFYVFEFLKQIKSFRGERIFHPVQ